MSWASNRAALRAHYVAKAPVAEARINLSAIGGKKFRTPAIPSVDGLSEAARDAALAAVVHVRLEIVGGRGGRAQFVTLGADAPTATRGQVLQRFFYPAGYGESFMASIISDAMGVFHPSHVIDGGELEFEETEEPEEIEDDPDAPKWASIVVATNYFVTRSIAAA